MTTAIEPEQQEFAAPFEKANCPFELPEDATEGQDIVCGYVTVPEEHAHPDGPTIRLAFDPQGTLIATIGWDGVLALWRIPSE